MVYLIGCKGVLETASRRNHVMWTLGRSAGTEGREPKISTAKEPRAKPGMTIENSDGMKDVWSTGDYVVANGDVKL